MGPLFRTYCTAFALSLLAPACFESDGTPPSCDLAPDGVVEAAAPVALPLGILGQPALLGATVVRATAGSDEWIGNLKLTTLPTFVVTTRLVERGGQTYVEFASCSADCQDDDSDEVVLALRVARRICDGNVLELDAKQTASELTLRRLFGEEYWGTLEETNALVERAATVSAAGLADDTALVDVESTLSAATGSYAEDPERTDVTEFRATTRWFLRPVDPPRAEFAKRTASGSVGYFATTRRAQPLIAHWGFRRGETVTYYVKHLPADYQGALADAIQGWNALFEAVLGFAPLRYEILADDDPRNDTIEAGDPRYAVFEWDVDNRASYGGLGQVQIDERTGEIFGAAVLIQGPQLLSLYREWYEVSRAAEAQAAEGDRLGAARTMRDGLTRLRARSSGRPLRVAPPPSMERLREPVPRFDFDPFPADETLDSFLQGMMREIFEHELGHTLGLTHNFMGTLSDDGTVPSHSVMEYVARVDRPRTRIARYDEQAIAYGYAGQEPDMPLPFCNGFSGQPSEASPECSADDATADPFTYFRLKRVARSFDLLLGRGLSEPVWTFGDLAPQLSVGVNGMAAYATGAEESSSDWTNFFLDPTRPNEPDAIRDYVLRALEDTVCDPAIEQELSALAERNASAAERAADEVKRARDFASSALQSAQLPALSCGG